MISSSLGSLCSIWIEPASCSEEDGGFSFTGDLRQLAVSSSSVYIATEEKLYQSSHDSTSIHSSTQRGILENEEDKAEFYRVSMNAAWNATFHVNVLLPFVKNNTVISCGVTDLSLCGYCEISDSKNISKLVHREAIQVGPQRSSSGSVSFSVDVKKDSVQTETYISTAIQNHRNKTEEDKCAEDLKMINLHNTDQNQPGDIFSWADRSGNKPGIQTESDVEFVDGFQINSTVYSFSNVASGPNTNKVRLIWLQAESSKAETSRSLRGATLSTSDGGEGSRSSASSVIPGGQQVSWSGVFSEDGGETNTQSSSFDISPDQSRKTNTDPDFYYSTNIPNNPSEPVASKPKTVLLNQNLMSSVSAVRSDGWMVFFIGTADGQLIKLPVDRNYEPACPKFLYRTSGDNRVFPQIQLEPVDQKHVYVPFKNQVKRVPASKCSTYQNMKDCFSAQDPFCVWCVSKESCTFKGDCKDSEWLSIPDESKQKIVSHRVSKDSTGEMKLEIQTHLTTEQKVQSRFACQFSTTSTTLCKEQEPPHYPQCTCILNDPFPDDLDVTIKIRLGGTFSTEQIKMINCSSIQGQPSFNSCQRCIRGGCEWRQSSCSWAGDPVQTENTCSNIESFGRNFSKPEIFSITPSVVSFYGRNHAVSSGPNLRDVTRVRIKADSDCDPKESPVWNNNGTSSMFHIPTTEMKGVVKVCVLLLDGSCHGSFKITYQSSPICTDMVPSSSWRGGKRNITLLGTHSDLVEGIIHSHAPQEVILSRSSSYQKLTYESPAAKVSSSTVFSKVANQTSECSKKLTYYPEPEFTGFTVERQGKDVRIVIQKKVDNSEMTPAEVSVVGIHNEKQHPCIIKSIEKSNKTETFICEIEGLQNADINEVKISYGEAATNSSLPSKSHVFSWLLLIPCIIAVIFCSWRKNRFSAETNQL